MTRGCTRDRDEVNASGRKERRDAARRVKRAHPRESEEPEEARIRIAAHPLPFLPFLPSLFPAPLRRA